jgi:glutamate-1-semialdehyde aminotransferase/spore coat polysaccharide biosynthesis protein SpsF (cytidylyltransferase family)
MELKTVLITQARMGSSRFPNKIAKEILGKSLLEIHLGRIKKAKCIDEIIVATTTNVEDEIVFNNAVKWGFKSFRGSENDVLDRFYQSIKYIKPEWVVRATSDCPLIDPELIDTIINFCLDNNLDYCTNGSSTFPDGTDVEVFKFSCLEEMWNKAELLSEREHVTPYLINRSNLNGKNEFKAAKFTCLKDWSDVRITIDNEEDFLVIQKLITDYGVDKDWEFYAQKYYDDKLNLINGFISRNEGYSKSVENDKKIMNKSEFVKKIHELIPGGAHTYSKGDDQFSANAPTGIQKGKGAWLWDINSDKYLDCSMGLGSVTLGHAYEPVLQAVTDQLAFGVNFQRPSLIELAAAEKFLSLLPNQDMIKFSKNGSTVTTAAVKLARAFTGRDLVAFPYDHPFYSYDDWFIGKTACNKGVPKAFSELSVTFKSCDIDSLEKMFRDNSGKVACVIMEPEKFHCGPQCSCQGATGAYLKAAIELCHKNGALFILDEMVTGFKVDFPGCVTKYNINPDMITWGKGIANGFSCSALTGTREVMSQGGILEKGKEKVFLISTTHGAEGHSLAALMATIDFYKDENIVDGIHEKGKQIIDATRSIIDKHGMQEYIQALDSVWTPVWIFHGKEEKNSLSYKTFFMQEMVKSGVLFQGAIVPSLSHGREEIDFFLIAFEKAVIAYKGVIENNNLSEKLEGESIKPVFRQFL